jgi:cobalt/nickel transport system permease protein
VLSGILISLIAVLLSPLASGNPDGLERVAQDLGFFDRSLDTPYQLLPDYTIPFLGETALSTIIAGAAGVMLLVGLIILVGRNQIRKNNL